MEFTKRRTIAKSGNEAWVSCVNQFDDTITKPTVSASSGLVRYKYFTQMPMFTEEPH